MQPYVFFFKSYDIKKIIFVERVKGKFNNIKRDFKLKFYCIFFLLLKFMIELKKKSMLANFKKER